MFCGANLIAEIKSLTGDRANGETVSAKLGTVLEQGAAYGAPIVFGSKSIKVHDLPRTVGERAIRVLGARARKEVIAAARQIEQTRTALAMPDAYGLVVFISPAHVLGQQTLRWLIHDLLQQRGDFAGLDGAMLIQSPLRFEGRGITPGPSLGDAWVAVTGQTSRAEVYEAFARHGMVE